jgi:hypothetical protein
MRLDCIMTLPYYRSVFDGRQFANEDRARRRRRPGQAILFRHNSRNTNMILYQNIGFEAMIYIQSSTPPLLHDLKAEPGCSFPGISITPLSKQSLRLYMPVSQTFLFETAGIFQRAFYLREAALFTSTMDEKRLLDANALKWQTCPAPLFRAFAIATPAGLRLPTG